MTGPSSDAMTGEVLTPAEAADLFSPLAAYRYLLLAVSGGSDSVALMLLMARWARQLEAPPKIEVATIDHGLRDGSAEEARWVGELAARIGFHHHVRRWQDEKPETGIQAAARNARYRLLGDIVADRAASMPAAVVTAHSEDDQAETVIMRLARGSGIDGLGAMTARRSLSRTNNKIDLVRPLLTIAKTRLTSYLTQVDQDWCDDPSNASQEFERVRLRTTMSALADAGITPSALALSAKRAGRASAALQTVTENYLSDRVEIRHGALGATLLSDFQAQPEDVQIRILRALVAAFGGSAPAPQLAQFETLVAKLEQPTFPATTLGGAIIAVTRDQLTLCREPGREPLPMLRLQPGESALWDQRFWVTLSAETVCDRQAGQGVSVQALGAAAFANLKPTLSPDSTSLPAAAAQSLPSFWCEDRLVAVPSLNIDQQSLRDIGMGASGPEGAGEEAGHRPCTCHCQARFAGLTAYHNET